MGILQAIPSPTHELCASSILIAVGSTLSATGLNQHVSVDGNRDEEISVPDAIGPDVSVFVPDMGLYYQTSNGNSSRVMVLEVGFSESEAHLRQKARKWFDVATMRMVVLVNINETPRYRDPQGYAPRDALITRMQAIQVPNDLVLPHDEEVAHGLPAQNDNNEADIVFSGVPSASYQIWTRAATGGQVQEGHTVVSKILWSFPG